MLPDADRVTEAEGEGERDVDRVALVVTVTLGVKLGDAVRLVVGVGLRDVDGVTDAVREMEPVGDADQDTLRVTEADNDVEREMEMVLVAEMDDASFTSPASVLSTVWPPVADTAMTRRVMRASVSTSDADTRKEKGACVWRSTSVEVVASSRYRLTATAVGPGRMVTVTTLLPRLVMM